MMIINDIEFKKLAQLGFVTGIRATELLKKNKPVWRLEINLKDTDEVAYLYTQRHLERTFSKSETLLAYVRRCFGGEAEITFCLSKDISIAVTDQEETKRDSVSS